MRTETTERDYEHRAQRLLTAYRQETGLSWKEYPVLACQHIAAKRQYLGKSTWRQYRSALIYFMTKNGPIEAVNFLKNCGVELCRPAATRTSAQKTHALPQEDLVELLTFLARGKGCWDRILGLWLVAGRMTGLRPGEWNRAELTSGPALSVVNAKHTNGRGHGERRTLLLDKLPPDRLRAIQNFLFELHELRDKGVPFSSVYSSCRRRMTRVTRQLWPNRKKRPSLYSTRHQVAADCKATGTSLAELAAILGHATDETASVHYGRRAAGEKSGGRVSVPETETARIRQTYRPRPQPKTIPEKGGD